MCTKMRNVVLDDGTCLNVSYYVSIANCAHPTCSVELVYCDHGSLDAREGMRHPNCVCEDFPLVCKFHQKKNYQCAGCQKECAAYDCGEMADDRQCLTDNCTLKLCNHCVELGRTHCESHREIGG